MDAALKGISEEVKAAYKQALVRAPMVVATETPFERFLVTEQQNSVAAAARLCRYWQERLNLFQERAFLPMDLTGSGALNPEDIELINTACVVILPPDTDTQKKRTVIACDDGRLDGSKFALNPQQQEDDFHLSKMRMCFYFFQVASENQVSQTLGIAVFKLERKAQHTKVDSQLNTLLQYALPIRQVEFHMVFFPKRFQAKKQDLICWDSIIDDLIVYKLRLLSFISNMSFTHEGKTEEEVLQKLLKCGFKKRCLPTWYGGSFSFEDFQVWQKRRISTKQDNDASKALSNAIRSKRKRERRKQELEMLQEQKRQLLSANATLQQNNEYFERLLANVETEIATLSDIPQPGLLDLFLLEPEPATSIPADELIPADEVSVDSAFLDHLVSDAAALPSLDLGLTWESKDLSLEKEDQFQEDSPSDKQESPEKEMRGRADKPEDATLLSNNGVWCIDRPTTHPPPFGSRMDA